MLDVSLDAPPPFRGVPPMNIIVCGGRDFTRSTILFEALDRMHAESPITLVIEGGQRTMRDRIPVGGADFWAFVWAAKRGVRCRTVEAKWHDLSYPDAQIRTGNGGRKYDANAGPRRNTEMLTMRPDRVVAFKGGDGTADMVRQARAAGIPVTEVKP